MKKFLTLLLFLFLAGPVFADTVVSGNTAQIITLSSALGGGTANYILGENAAGNGIEWKSFQIAADGSLPSLTASLPLWLDSNKFLTTPTVSQYLTNIGLGTGNSPTFAGLTANGILSIVGNYNINIWRQQGIFSSVSGANTAGILFDNDLTKSLDLIVNQNVSALHIDVNGNVGIATSTFGTSAIKVLGIGLGTNPTTTPSGVTQIWSSSLHGAGSAQLGLFQEYAPYAGAGVASTTKIPINVNGTQYYLLATTVQ